MKRSLVCALGLFALVALVARVETRAGEDDVPAWRKLRPDAPEEPKGEAYSWKEPEGWAPPSMEELKGVAWQDGRVADAMEIGRDRIKATKPLCTVEEALALKNDSKENNDKIVSVMCQYPKSEDEVDWDATMNRHSAQPTNLNPMLASSTYEIDMTGLLAASPWSFDHQMVRFVDRDMAKRWRHSETIDLIELRDDLVWDDGTPFTAYDIEFSYHVVMDPKVPVPAQRTGPDQLRWVKAYDNWTIVYFHKDALPTNQWNVSFSILPKHIYQRSLSEDPTMKASAWHAYWNRNPLSAGGYRLKSWTTGQELVFERREAYYQRDPKTPLRAKPYFKQIRFRTIEDNNAALLALKKGELDDMVLTASQWTRQTDDDEFYKYSTKVRGPQWMYGYVGWNQRPIPDKPYFKDARVRKAMALVFDHKEYLNKVCFGLYEDCAGPFHPDSPWGSRDTKPLAQDLDEAEKLLDEAGWKVGASGVREKDGVPFEFTISVPTGGTGAQIAELFKQNLKDVGVTMNIKMLEWATYQTMTFEHKFEACIAAWGTGTDPDSSKNIWKTEMYDKGRNYVGYSNARVDELFDQGQREFDFDKRRKIYQEINKLIYQDQPYMFCNYRSTLWAFSKEMRGYNFSPRGLFTFSPGISSMWKPKKKAS